MSHPEPGRLSAFLDGSLSPDDAGQVEGHLAQCQHCAELLQDLDGIRKAARVLPDHAPPRDLWPGIAEAIRSQGDDPDVIRLHPTRIGGGGARGASGTRRRGLFLSIPQAVAAGLVIALLSGTVVAQLNGRGSGGAMETTAAGAIGEPIAWVRMVADAEPGLEARALEVARLEATLMDAGDRLDPATAAVLRQNLAVIDEAIRESSKALQTDPENRFLVQNLERSILARADFVRDATLVAFPTT